MSSMATKERSLFMRLIRRPIKIVKNFFVLQIITSLLALLIASLLPYEPFKLSDHGQQNLEVDSGLFTKEQLAQFNGENGKPLYLALLGSVFDVTKGARHYGKDCSYNFFVGRDASVSFVTGEFDNVDADIADDVIGQLQPNDFLGLDNWKKFYEKDYIYKGKLIGRFYDDNGMATTYHHKYLEILKQAQEAKAEVDQLEVMYPDCNIEWSEEKGTHVWCTRNSGGKERDWIGYPRKLFQIGSDKFRCACIREEDFQTTRVMLKEFENCQPRSRECFYRL